MQTKILIAPDFLPSTDMGTEPIPMPGPQPAPGPLPPDPVPPSGPVPVPVRGSSLAER